MASDRQKADGEHRKVNMLELFIMGELMDGPHHGYLLRDILSRVFAPFRQFSWGTLYPLIGQLERSGYIELIDGGERSPREEKPHGRQKRNFGITDAGRARFQVLMLANSEYTADFPELLTVKLLYLRWLTPTQQLAVLEHSRGYFVQTRDYCLQAFTAQSPSAHLPAEAREQIYRIVNFRLSGTQAQLSWIEGEIARRRIALDTMIP
jgi:DNA-binding PadR family transcriptional regulator